MDDLKPYQTNHLFLLIGTNPLPNYVAARLLAKPDGRIYLVHSVETAGVANRLVAALGLDRGNGIKIQVDDADAHNIFGKVKAHAPGEQSVGLNYTGGTKAMAVHAYGAVRSVNSAAVFSYLEARTLEMLIDRTGAPSRRYSVDVKVHVSLETLLGMHGVTYDHKKVRKEPVQIDLSATLAHLHTTKEGVQTWWNWRRNKSQQWRTLPNGEPGLEEVEAALTRMCGGATPTPDLVTKALGYERLSFCTHWFKSEWLENYTLHALKQVVSQRNDVRDFGMNLMCSGKDPQGRSFEFQFDVAAMRSYQLFALSCIASDRKDCCKEHLFEAYIRARQMGGDEARVALVCAYRDPEGLLAEIEKPWDAAGKIRVFGAEHLPNLADYLQDWFNTQP